MHASIKKLVAALAATVFGTGSVHASVVQDGSTSENKTLESTKADAGSNNVIRVAQAVDIDTFLKSYAGSSRPVIIQRKTRNSTPPSRVRSRRSDY